MTDPAERAEPTAPETPPPASGATRPDAPRDAPATPEEGAGPVAPWAPPGAAPFGVPAGPAASGAHAAPGADGGAPGAQGTQPVCAPPPGYAPPHGYAPPPGYAPPAGYTPMVGSGATVSGAPAAASGSPLAFADARGRRSNALGVVALVLALLAAFGASSFAALASFNIGLGTGREIAMRALETDFDWSILTPVRDWVLLGEVSFWTGTVLGITALVLGIVAIVTRRGRGVGIAAVVIAALGPVVFGVFVQGFLTAGFTAGSGLGG